MARNAKGAILSTSAFRLHMLFLRHHVIKAGLAVESFSTFSDEQGDGAAPLAFEITKFIAVNVAILLTVA